MLVLYACIAVVGAGQVTSALAGNPFWGLVSATNLTGINPIISDKYTGELDLSLWHLELDYKGHRPQWTVITVVGLRAIAPFPNPRSTKYATNVLAEASEIAKLDINTVTIADLEHNINGNFSFKCTGSSKVHGFACWFQTGFPDGTVLSTDPKEQKTHWKQSLIYIDDPIAVEKDTPIEGEITLAPNKTNRSRETPGKPAGKPTMKPQCAGWPVVGGRCSGETGKEDLAVGGISPAGGGISPAVIAGIGPAVGGISPAVIGISPAVTDIRWLVWICTTNFPLTTWWSCKVNMWCDIQGEHVMWYARWTCDDKQLDDARWTCVVIWNVNMWCDMQGEYVMVNILMNHESHVM